MKSYAFKYSVSQVPDAENVKRSRVEEGNSGRKL